MIMENYEEKYNEALKNAKQGKPIEEIFPELAESEDEKIRKKLINFVLQWDRVGGIKYTSYKSEIKEILRWLEKQKKTEQ